MKKLIGGINTQYSTVRVYRELNEFVLYDSTPAPLTVLESLAIYLILPPQKSFKTKIYKGSDNTYCCEQVYENEYYEVFVCGYGKTEAEAVNDAWIVFNKLRKDYLSR